jgi:hypothetical protein
MSRKERKVVSFGKAPKGYVAGVGRGAKPITSSTGGKRKRDDDDDTEPSLSKAAKRQNVEKKHWIDRVEGEEDAEGNLDETKFMAFNLKSEMAEGKYLADGSYVRFKDNEKLDPWLEDVVQNKIVYKEKKTSSTKEKEETPKMTVNEAVGVMAKILLPNETVSASMKRLGKVFKKQNTKKVKPWLKNKKNSTTTTVEAPQADRDSAKLQFEQLTEAADVFMLNGLQNIYQCNLSILEQKLKMSDMTFQNPWAIGRRVRIVSTDQYAVITSSFDSETSQFQVRLEATNDLVDVKVQDLEAASAENVETKNDGMMWEYKWKEDSKEIHGPYTTTIMKQWKQQGYFVGQYRALVRKWKAAPKNSEKAKDTDVQSLMNDLEDSDEEENDDEVLGKKSEWFLSDANTF